MLKENDHDHNHQEVETPVETVEPVMLENTAEHAHDHEGLSGLWEVMFGFEHVVAEFFWNAVFILGTFLFTRAVALRKIHKYVDDRHGMKHDKY